MQSWKDPFRSRLPANFVRLLAGFCWVTAAWLAMVAFNEILHRSKVPNLLFWSTKKVVVCTGLLVLAGIFFWIARKLVVPGLPKFFANSHAPFVIFLTLVCIWFSANFSIPLEVAGDLQFQMHGFRQYLAGATTLFNSQVVPVVGQDLAKDQVIPIIWYPPGPMWILLPFAKLGIHPDLAARLMIFFGFLSGGLGFLYLAKHIGISHNACLVYAVVLAFCTFSRDGLAVVTPTSADCVGLATFPWLCLATLKLSDGVHQDTRIRDKALPFVLVGLGTGALYIIKYSWFVAAACLASFLGIAVFFLVRKLPFKRRVVLMGLYSICFFMPFFGLNNYYQKLAGGSALDYNEKGSLGDNAFIEMVYGPNFSSTARPQELPFSIAAGPGFLLGGNMFATRVVHFLRQESTFTRFFQEHLRTNAHVWALILICLPFTCMVVLLLASFLPRLDANQGAFLLTMVFLPLALLGYLSLKSGFNYIVKDNYRYVIPYSLLVQALLLHVWLGNSPHFRGKISRCFLGMTVFWVCIFPGLWGLQAYARETIYPSGSANQEIPTQELNALVGGKDKSITFFLNGQGPRKIGIMPRESHISFVLDGGLGESSKFLTSQPMRVIVAVESNLDPNRLDIQLFLKRFPGISWETIMAPDSLYPVILFGDIFPSPISFEN